MTFNQLFPYFAVGVPIKRKPWLGYWQFDQPTKAIIMYTKEGDIIPLIETNDILYTISNIVSDDWEIATNEKCSIPVKEA